MPFDPTKKFVRVKELRKDGFVDFDFAVGEPALFVEMLLPAAAFDDFCTRNHVVFLGEGVELAGRDHAWAWRLREARHHRLT